MTVEIEKYVTYNPEDGTIKRVSDGKILGWPDKNGYIEVRIEGKTFKAHRIAFRLMGKDIPKEVGHKNGIPYDNRWENLEETSHSANMKNLKKNSNNTSGINGVSWSNTHQRWVVKVSNRTIGYFRDKEVATKVRGWVERNEGYSERHGT